jgi:hypothetical protein
MSMFDLKFMSIAKNHQGKTNRISDFSGGRRKALVLASLLVRRLPYGLPILFFFL